MTTDKTDSTNKKNQTAKIMKIFSDFYYAEINSELIECKMRENIKKSGEKIMVGDEVVLDEFNNTSKQAVITEVLPRINYITRPGVANIDQIILIISLRSPDVSFSNVDRYLAQAIYFNIDIKICINKSDLISDAEIRNFTQLYKGLGYEVICTSAINKTGIDKLNKMLKNKTSLLSGPSGVGKSSLCNLINNNFVMKTGSLGKNSKGTHTTRHCQIFKIDEKTNLVDTPGFSLLKFDYIEPEKVKDFFPEIKALSQHCKYSDCLHENEDECYVRQNTDKIPASRLESYIGILQEAKLYKERIKFQGSKTETRQKQTHSKTVPKISARKRDKSRKNIKQNLEQEYDIQ